MAGFKGFRRFIGFRGEGIAASRCTANTFCRSVSDAQNVVSRFPFRGDEYVCCLAAAKTVQPGLRPVGNAPLFPYGDFPRRRKFALCPAFELISISKHSAAKTSPSGGGAVGRRGAFPRAIGPVVWFSLARKGGCKGFIHNGGEAAHLHPLNPLHLLYPLNPHAPKGVSTCRITPVSRALPSPCRRGTHSGGNRFRSPVSLRGIPAFHAR